MMLMVRSDLRGCWCQRSRRNSHWRSPRTNLDRRSEAESRVRLGNLDGLLEIACLQKEQCSDRRRSGCVGARPFRSAVRPFGRENARIELVANNVLTPGPLDRFPCATLRIAVRKRAALAEDDHERFHGGRLFRFHVPTLAPGRRGEL